MKINEKYWNTLFLNDTRQEVVSKVISFLDSQCIPFYQSVLDSKEDYVMPYIGVSEEGVIDRYGWADEQDLFVSAEKFIKLLTDIDVKIEVKCEIRKV